MSIYNASLDWAQEQDAQDPISNFRDQFHIPKHDSGEECIYFCGNSLGLQPKAAMEKVHEEMTAWAQLAVKGHFRQTNPWIYYHRPLAESMARMLHAGYEEVTVMNTLTVNLHLMLVSFYRPTPTRFKILMEGGAFPSDRYAVASQVRWHGYDPEQAILQWDPSPGSDVLEIDHLNGILEKEGHSIALVLLGGINYYSGQLLPMKQISQAARRAGSKVGFDLAHAVGNVDLNLGEIDPDFAVWCTYKYMNTGPGNLAGCYINKKYAHDYSVPRLAGWWGQKMDSRFGMREDFDAMPGAEGWQISNIPIVGLAAIKASLHLFEQAGMPALEKKSQRLTGYLEFLLQEIRSPRLKIITPSDPAQRGCQLSVLVRPEGKKIFEALSLAGVVCDWRDPDVIRMAPVPLYNTFEEVFKVGHLLQKLMNP